VQLVLDSLWAFYYYLWKRTNFFELSAGGGSGSARFQGTPFGRPSTSSGESASDAAMAVARGADIDVPRFRVDPGGDTQDANACNPMLTRPVVIMDLEAAGAADADQTQTRAVIDGAVPVTNPAAAAAAAAKSESDDDSSPADSRKRQVDADDDCKPPAKRAAGADQTQPRAVIDGAVTGRSQECPGCLVPSWLAMWLEHFSPPQLLEEVDHDDADDGNQHM
jgi:hypothetical protein